IEALRHQSFEIGVRAVHARSVSMINADAEHEIVLRHANIDFHLDADRASGAEGHELAAFVVNERDALQHHLTRPPALLLGLALWGGAALRGALSRGRRSPTRNLLQIVVDHACGIADRLRLAAIQPQRAIAEIA